MTSLGSVVLEKRVSSLEWTAASIGGDHSSRQPDHRAAFRKLRPRAGNEWLEAQLPNFALTSQPTHYLID